jgi:hypothetical protein
MRSRLLHLGLAAALIVGTVACDESLSSLTGPTPNLEPTFGSLQREIFDRSCVGCHTSQGRVPAAGLELTSAVSYAQLVGVASPRSGVVRVAPSNPGTSYIVQKLEGTPGILGARMPLLGTPLTEGQMRVVRRWIELGARND